MKFSTRNGLQRLKIFYMKGVAKFLLTRMGVAKGGCTFSTDLGPCLGMTETDNVCIVPWLKISANLPRDIFEYGSGFSG